MDYETKRPLMEKIDKALLEHTVAAGTKEGGPEILDAYLLQGLAETHYYLKVEHDFKPDEVAALLQFTDPLFVARECWEERDPEKGFPICELLKKIEAYDRFPLADPAGYAQQQEQMENVLNAVLDQNMAEFHASFLSMDKEEIIAKSGQISIVQDAYDFIKDYDFKRSDVETLLRMENPLGFVASHWPADMDGLFDMKDMISEAIDEAGKEAANHRVADVITPERRTAISTEVQASLQMLVNADLNLYGEVTGDTLAAIETQGFALRDGVLQKNESEQDGPAQSEQETSAAHAKPSVRGQLRKAAQEVGQRPPPDEKAKGGKAR